LVVAKLRNLGPLLDVTVQAKATLAIDERLDVAGHAHPKQQVLGFLTHLVLGRLTVGRSRMERPYQEVDGTGPGERREGEVGDVLTAPRLAGVEGRLVAQGEGRN
jgi:hypothetical protein